MSAKTGTYLIEFSDGNKIVCGNNYKSWNAHAVEYAWYKYQDGRPHKDLLKSVKFNDKKFADDGGLKFATPKAYQEIIDKLHIKGSGDHYNFDDLDFYYSNADKKKLDEDLKYWGLI